MSPPERIGRYEVVEQIGKGGFATVYLAVDPDIKREVAVKVCDSKADSVRRRFVHEAEMAGGLDHPNIVRVYDFGRFEDCSYLVQEYLDGSDIRQTIEDAVEVPYAERLRWLVGVAQGMVYAHAKGILHRDIKPENVRVRSDGAVKILDFGIAKLERENTPLTQTGSVVGTAGYLSPEQVLGRGVDPRADVFSFGALAFELMTYARPFHGETITEVLNSVLSSEPPPLVAFWPACPPEVQSLVTRCLAKSRDDRYQSFAEVVDVLTSLGAVVAEADRPSEQATVASPEPTVLMTEMPEIPRPEAAAAPSTEPKTLPVEGEAGMRSASGPSEPESLCSTAGDEAARELSDLTATASPAARGRLIGIGAVVVLAVGLVVSVVGLRDGDGEPEVGEDPVAAPVSRPTEVPLGGGVARARLVVDAVPWGTVVRISAADGTAVGLGHQATTPMIRDLDEGSYEIEIHNPHYEDSQRCGVTVSRGQTSFCSVRFVEATGVDYFKDAGWWP